MRWQRSTSGRLYEMPGVVSGIVEKVPIRKRDGGMPVAEERSELSREEFEALGVDPNHVAGWMRLNVGPFEAALAQGDGFTPGFAVDYQGQLHRTAESWRRVGLDSHEGLRWHRAGFGAKEVTRWQLLGVDVEAARGLRAGYRHDGPARPPRHSKTAERRGRHD